MIPRTSAGLDDLLAEAKRQNVEVAEILGALSDEDALWRPDETHWSAAGHIAHLVIINTAYLGPVESAIEAAVTVGGPRSDGPYRHPRMASWFAGSMEPPPKRRMKTFRAMVPDAGASRAEASADFDRIQGRLIGAIERARGLDLGRVRFRSPFLSLLRFSLGSGFEMLLAHNRRHIWLVRELLATTDFPGS
jgi:hypothetical protein